MSIQQLFNLSETITTFIYGYQDCSNKFVSRTIIKTLQHSQLCLIFSKCRKNLSVIKLQTNMYYTVYFPTQVIG